MTNEQTAAVAEFRESMTALYTANYDAAILRLHLERLVTEADRQDTFASALPGWEFLSFRLSLVEADLPGLAERVEQSLAALNN